MEKQIKPMEKVTNRLLEENSKTWLADQLGITRNTLDVRLTTQKWKKGEIILLMSLYKKINCHA
jgi:hypothetical protein